GAQPPDWRVDEHRRTGAARASCDKGFGRRACSRRLGSGTQPRHHLSRGAGDAALMAANAHELVDLAPDAILARGGTMPALRDATAMIPIVFVVTGDDAALSYAGEFAHSRRNMTGFTTPEGELVGKRLQLLREIAPRISRVLYLWSREVGGAGSPALFM